MWIGKLTQDSCWSQWLLTLITFTQFCRTREWSFSVAKSCLNCVHGGGRGRFKRCKSLSISSVRPIIYQTELTTLVILWYYLICSLDRQALWVEFVIQPRSTNGPFVTIRVWPIIHSNSAQIACTKKGLFHQDSEHCKDIARITNAVTKREVVKKNGKLSFTF